MSPFAAILVVVLIQYAGNPPYQHVYAFSTMAACEQAIKTAVLLPAGHDDRRGVQAMFCIEAPKP